MRPRILTLFAPLSLAVCVATLFFWVRSTGTVDTWTWNTAQSSRILRSRPCFNRGRQTHADQISRIRVHLRSSAADSSSSPYREAVAAEVLISFKHHLISRCSRSVAAMASAAAIFSFAGAAAAPM
jgi:hypothetical protein